MRSSLLCSSLRPSKRSSRTFPYCCSHVPLPHLLEIRHALFSVFLGPASPLLLDIELCAPLYQKSLHRFYALSKASYDYLQCQNQLPCCLTMCSCQYASAQLRTLNALVVQETLGASTEIRVFSRMQRKKNKVFWKDVIG